MTRKTSTILAAALLLPLAPFIGIYIALGILVGALKGK